MNNNLHIKFRIDREFLASLLILIPYLESTFLVEYGSIWVRNDLYIRPTSLICIVILTICIFSTLANKGKRTTKLSSTRIATVFAVITLASTFFTDDITRSLCVWLWGYLPLITSVALISYFIKNNYNIRKLIINSINIFILHAFVIVAFSIPVYGLFINANRRLSPRGGGPVIFGYTLAIVFSLCMIYKKDFNGKGYYFRLIILTVAAFGTMSRASVWPIVALWILNFLLVEKTKGRIVASFILIPVLLFLMNYDYSSILTDTFIGRNRLLNIASNRRTISNTNLLAIFISSPVMVRFLGNGIGSFFPYIEWIVNGHNVDNNMLSVNGRLVMVQPHNTFLYTLIESGILGEIFLISIFLVIIITTIKNKPINHIYRIIFIVTIIFVNNFDSMLLIEPGVSLIVWLFLFLVDYDGHCNLYVIEETSYEKSSMN